MRQTNWEDETFRISYSDTFSEGTVDIDILKIRRGGYKWVMELTDMAPAVLEQSEFPARIVKAARRVSRDKKTRVVMNR